MIQAVIQAGGKGTRLSAVTHDVIPKPMVEIAGRPLLAWQIDELKKCGINDFIIIVGHLGQVIEQYFGDGGRVGVNIAYVREKEEQPLGTAGALPYLKPLLLSDEFVFAYADAFFSLDVQRMLAFHHDHGSKATLFVHPNSHPYDSDLVVLDDDGRVIRFDSKHNDRSSYDYDNIVNAGFFIFHKSVCDYVPEPQKVALEKDVIQQMVDNGQPVYGYLSTEYVKDAGTVDRLQAVEHDLQAGIIWQRNLQKKQRAIFLDRDGTLNKYVGLLTQKQQLELEQTVIDAVKRINSSAFLAICCTNQPVVARGLCSIADVEDIHRRLSTLLGQGGTYLDDIVYCPHHPDKGYPGENKAYKIECDCRKPKTGMLTQMAHKHNIDLQHSWFIGDTTRDLQTAANAGMRKALVLTGEAGHDNRFAATPDITASTLLEAVEQILEQTEDET